MHLLIYNVIICGTKCEQIKRYITVFCVSQMKIQSCRAAWQSVYITVMWAEFHSCSQIRYVLPKESSEGICYIVIFITV